MASLIVRTLLLIPVLVCALTTPVRADATVYCVNSGSSLNSALASANAAAEGSVHDIRVRPGTYAIPGGLLFHPAGDKDAKEFSLTGGWNADCSARAINPANTILNADNGNADGDLTFGGDNTSYIVEGISFRNFGSFWLFDPACGLGCPDTQLIRIRYNEFRNGNDVGLLAEDAATVSVTNNLLVDLHPASNFHALTVTYANTESIPVVSFNTVANVVCGSASTAALHVYSEVSGASVHHNIVQSSVCGASIDFSGQPAALRNNLYATRSGVAPSTNSGNVISASPGFVNAASGDFHLRETAPVSAAINAGMTPVQATQLFIALPSQDLDGPAGTRVIGTHVDIGAYESSINDSSVLTVTSTADSGAGTLRQALLSANAAPGLQRIEFNIAGACPRLILLDSPLPDVTDPLEIDGYSQPGSAANTLATGTDAQLCIAVLASTGTLDQALQVPQAAPAGTSLSVQGIAFGGSTGFNGNFTVAIRLRGGSDHQIQGDAFGGTGPGAIGSLGTLNFGLQIRGVAQNALIGGPDPEHRNSFGDMISSAIVLSDSTSGGHTIQNNYIGLTANGQQASPIGLNGIFASASPNIKILDNVIATVANSAAISITGATATGYTIRGNKLGTNAYSIPTVALRNGVGIQVAGGAGANEIGNSTGSVASNVITNSDGAGVWITATAGSGNLIRPNQIFDNGKSGTGLGIDLGALGPLPNDPLDGDGGPNNGQNWPQINASVPNPDGTRAVSFTLNSNPNTTMRVDIYRAPDCPAGNRGANLTTRISEVIGTTNAQGVLSATFNMSGAGAPGQLSAIATSTSSGDTSEAGNCYAETSANTLFADGFE
jgi:trimeric autotransporter adhesin